MASQLKQPTIRQKANGAFFVRWGGKDHYLSKDRAEAERLFLDPESDHPGSLAAWSRWRLSTPEQRRERRKSFRRPGGAASRLLVDVAEELLDTYYAQGRPTAAEYFTKHLARFLDAHGEARLLDLAVPRPERGVYKAPIVALLDAFRDDLQRARLKTGEPKYEPKTINHDLTAVQRLFNFAAERGYCPEIAWRGLRKLRTRRSEPRDLHPMRLFALMAAAHKARPQLLPYLALSYLCLLRPSEVVTLIMDVHGPPAHVRGRPPRRRRPLNPGRFLEVRDPHGKLISPRGLYSLSEHKNAWRGEQIERLVVLTDQALVWLDAAEPIWSTLDGYSHAVREAVPGLSPDMMRDSGASHLRARGVALEDVQILLGHAPRGEWPSYARTPWHALREAAARIAL